jgi:predicted acylesterase/phospholipase RssA
MELDTGRRIAEMFDVICGTSAGGLLAMALLLGRSLDEVLSLLALLVQTYTYRRAAGDGLAPRTLARRGTELLLVTGIKVPKGTTMQVPVTATALLLRRSLDEVLYLLLVQKYKKVPVRKELRMLARGTQFTCFTCTNVQILTLRAAD